MTTVFGPERLILYRKREAIREKKDKHHEGKRNRETAEEKRGMSWLV